MDEPDKCVLINLVDAALAHEGMDEHLYSALRAANDSMTPQAAEYVEGQYQRILVKIAKLQEPPDEYQLGLLHPELKEINDGPI